MKTGKDNATNLVDLDDIWGTDGLQGGPVPKRVLSISMLTGPPKVSLSVTAWRGAFRSSAPRLGPLRKTQGPLAVNLTLWIAERLDVVLLD